MRIIFLRVLISWWLIPWFSLIYFPFILLLTGSLKTASSDVSEIANDLWNGME